MPRTGVPLGAHIRSDCSCRVTTPRDAAGLGSHLMTIEPQPEHCRRCLEDGLLPRKVHWGPDGRARLSPDEEYWGIIPKVEGGWIKHCREGAGGSTIWD
jgi:hypothetical protein